MQVKEVRATMVLEKQLISALKGISVDGNVSKRAEIEFKYLIN